MEKLIRGDIVVVPFPFSDLSDSKRRPALVLASLKGDDVILCQITSQFHSDSYAICLRESDFKTGFLAKESFIRPSRIFTANKSLILRKVGHLSKKKHLEVIQTVIKIFEG